MTAETCVRCRRRRRFAEDGTCVECPPAGIQVIGPTFDREPGAPASACAPDSAEAWAALWTLDSVALRELGLREFGQVVGGTLYLFPGEWYSAIPDGFEVALLAGSRWAFDRDRASDDVRFGCLAYGVVVAEEVDHG